MSIENNILLINGSAIRPIPRFSMSYEKFTAGEYIIGGVIILNLEGQIYGTSVNNLRDKIKTISSYSSKCQTVKLSCGDSVLINGVGFIKSVSISPTDQPYTASYSMEIEIAKNYGSQPAVKKDADFASLYGLNIPDNIILKEYSESLSLSGDNSLGSATLYNGTNFTKAHLKLNGNISIGAYHHTCDTFSPDLPSKLYNIAATRIKDMLSLGNKTKQIYPILSDYTGFSLVHDNKSITIDKLNSKINWKFDVFLYKGNCNPKAITDLTISESRDQQTGMHTISLRGQVTGLNNSTTDVIDSRHLSSDKINNARQVANLLMNRPAAEYYDVTLIGGCLNAANRPSNTCYQRLSSSITENVHDGVVSIDMSWGDAENCEIAGTVIDVTIQEDFPTHKHVEHIIPGRGISLVQMGLNQTLGKATITVSGNMNSCDLSDMSTLSNCVNNKFNSVISEWGYSSWFKTKEVISSGKYTYKKTQSFIYCPGLG